MTLHGHRVLGGYDENFLELNSRDELYMLFKRVNLWHINSPLYIQCLAYENIRNI